MQSTIETGPLYTDKLFLTIAVPTLNRLSYLRETLTSVFGQTCDDFEVLVSNNCSSDGTKEYLDRLDDLRVTVYHQKTPLSMTANWNFLLERAKADFFLLLSDDDLIGTDFVGRCKEAFSGQRDRADQITVIYGSTGIIDSQGTIQDHWKNDDLEPLESGEELVINWFKGLRPVSFCSTLFRTESFRYIGGFDETNRYAADAVARARLSVNHQALYVREAVAYYRIHDTNATFQNFNPADRLRYNLDISLQAIKDVTNSEKKEEIRRAGEKYAKMVFISESALGSATDFKLRMVSDFVGAYLTHFSLATLLFFDLVRYLRRTLLECNLKRPMHGDVSSGTR